MWPNVAKGARSEGYSGSSAWAQNTATCAPVRGTQREVRPRRSSRRDAERATLLALRSKEGQRTEEFLFFNYWEFQDSNSRALNQALALGRVTTQLTHTPTPEVRKLNHPQGGAGGQPLPQPQAAQGGREGGARGGARSRESERRLLCSVSLGVGTRPWRSRLSPPHCVLTCGSPTGGHAGEAPSCPK